MAVERGFGQGLWAMGRKRGGRACSWGTEPSSSRSGLSKRTTPLPLTVITAEHLQLGARACASIWPPAWWREDLGSGAGPPDPCTAVIMWLTPHRTAWPSQPGPRSHLLLYPFFAPGHGQPTVVTGHSESWEYEEMPAQAPDGGREIHFTYTAPLSQQYFLPPGALGWLLH